jgi:broad specificity phosphatase PhoE
MQTLDVLDIHIPMVLDERIREFDYGQFNQAKTDEISHIIKNYFRDAEHGMIHNKIGVSGESYFSLVSRIYSFMTELLERNEDSLVISHESIFLEIGKLWKVLHPSLAAEEILVKQGELTELVFLSADVALIDRRFDEIKNSRGLNH